MNTPVMLGRYEVLGPLESGGMAEILLARLTGASGFERLVVIKRIHKHLCRDRDFVKMFLDEARLGARIIHPNVIQVQEVGIEGDEYFQVMEYLEGESLGSLLKRLVGRGQALEAGLAAYVLAEACAGLHAAHELKDDKGSPLNLVHRDISPQNLFVTYDGHVKVLDFGVAKAADSLTQTEAGQFKGRFEYMSPEQSLFDPLDRRSDIFALGIVLWEVVTGHRLFKRANPVKTFRAIQKERARAPSRVEPSCPIDYDRVCLKALAIPREERYPDAASLRADLLAIVRSQLPDQDPRARLSGLLHELFADRLESKAEMVRRARSGSRAEEIVITPEEVHTPDPIEVYSQSVDDGVAEPGTTQTAALPFKRWGIPVIVLLAIVGVVGFVAFRSAQSQRPSLQTTASVLSASASLAPGTASAAPSSAASVVVKLETRPSRARAYVEGREQGETPLEMSLPWSTQQQSVEFRRSGYAAAQVRVIPSADQSVVVTLQPAVEAGPRSSPNPSKSGSSTATPVPTASFHRY